MAVADQECSGLQQSLGSVAPGCVECLESGACWRGHLPGWRCCCRWVASWGWLWAGQDCCSSQSGRERFLLVAEAGPGWGSFASASSSVVAADPSSSSAVVAVVV